MQNGYHTAKVEWIKDEPIPPEELGNMLFSLISDITGNNYIKWMATINFIVAIH